MISIIITSYKEPKTIGKAIRCIALPDCEIIQISPDSETLNAGLKVAQELNLGKNFKQIKDPYKGKPHALNMAFKKASGDILVLTDGDVFFDKNAVSELIKPFKDKKVGGVTGRPVSRDKKDNMMGYFGNLLSDAAHHKRMKTLKKGLFFPMSGYIMTIRNYGIELPKDVLSDDAYISYFVVNKGKEIAYAPKAKAFVKYPTNLNDYYKQKVRSLGGYLQLEKYGVIKNEKKTRTFKDELSYFWFPFSYASNIKEFFWSKLLFPIRIVTWIKIFFDRKVFKKDFEKSWIRIESTK
jgi:cellulose synthase/poly-beta-1,6-N-acetylglucosamine synthase-like glycosyltransferase